MLPYCSGSLWTPCATPSQLMSDRSLPRARMNKVANLNRPRVTLGPAETVSSQCVYQMWVLLGAPRDAVLEAFACVPLACNKKHRNTTWKKRNADINLRQQCRSEIDLFPYFYRRVCNSYRQINIHLRCSSPGCDWMTSKAPPQIVNHALLAFFSFFGTAFYPHSLLVWRGRDVTVYFQKL